MSDDYQCQRDLEREAIAALLKSIQTLNEAIDATRNLQRDSPNDLVLDDVLRVLNVSENSTICELLIAHVENLSKAIATTEALESTRAPPMNKDKPRAPLCLLSLRDYTTVQAAVELIIVWGVYPCIEHGTLVPLNQRMSSKTFKMDKEFIQRISNSLTPCPMPTTQLKSVLNCLLEVLQLSQFKPMLLPTYLHDLLASLLYSIHCLDDKDPSSTKDLLNTLMQSVPLRVIMSSLRGVLAQRHSNTTFRSQCGLLLSQCVLRDGGVLATIEMLLSTVDEGNTQARMHVATLISRCPKHLSEAEYLHAISSQLQELLTQNSTKLLREVSGLITTQLILDHQLDVVDELILKPLFTPLLRFIQAPLPSSSTLGGDISFLSTEDEINQSIAALKCVLLGPVPPKQVLVALAPLFQPLIYLFAFASSSKSYIKQDIQAILLVYIQQSPNASTELLSCLVMSIDKTRPQLYPQGSKESCVSFRPGGSGGVGLGYSSTRPSALDVIDPMVELLGHSQLDTNEVVGDLYSQLLTQYMDVKLSKAKDSPNPAALALLLSLTEKLGPAVLRSGECILKCLVTVLTMYVENTDDEDDEEVTEVLSVVLSMVMTIVEMGANTRAESEETLLRDMLTPLEQVATCPNVSLAEMASDLCLLIISRGTKEPSKPAPVTFEETLEMSKEDLQSPQVPLRARGLARLTKWIRRRERIDLDALFPLFIQQLGDTDSYVYLAAVQALSGLGDVHADKTIPMLLEAVQDDKTYSFEQRIKLGEALLFTARRCGEMVPKYSQGFVYCYLNCVRRTQSQPDLVEATFRASCLSNLAEICGLLRWAIHRHITDVMGCVKGILEVERQNTEPHTALRRGAVFLLYHMLQKLGRDIFEIVPEYMSPIYRMLKVESSMEKDEVCRMHAQNSLHELDSLMRGELFQVSQSTSSIPHDKPAMIFLN